jgi:hypothetical protein
MHPSVQQTAITISKIQTSERSVNRIIHWFIQALTEGHKLHHNQDKIYASKVKRQQHKIMNLYLGKYVTNSKNYESIISVSQQRNLYNLTAQQCRTLNIELPGAATTNRDKSTTLTQTLRSLQLAHDLS